jgi:hypothetical protein
MTFETIVAFLINYLPYYAPPMAFICLICAIVACNRTVPKHKFEIVQHEYGYAIYLNEVRIGGEHPTYVTKTIANFEVNEIDLKMGIENVR